MHILQPNIVTFKLGLATAKACQVTTRDLNDEKQPRLVPSKLDVEKIQYVHSYTILDLLSHNLHLHPHCQTVLIDRF